MYRVIHYNFGMASDDDMRASRLRHAREQAGFENAADAARRYGWPVVTYRSHENGIRGLKPAIAKKYAKAYKTSFSWLMTGEGELRSPGIDAELLALPPEVSAKIIEAVRALIAAAKMQDRVGDS